MHNISRVAIRHFSTWSTWEILSQKQTTRNII